VRTEHFRDISFARKVARAIRRRAESRLHGARVRFADRYHQPPPTELVGASPPWASLAAPPGSSADLDRVERQAAPRLVPGDRAWAVLSPSPVAVGIVDPVRLAAMEKAGSDLPIAAVREYRPIDWHRDPGSGYRWDSAQFYLDVRVAPVGGADIKGPRELSRFQHIGELANSRDDRAGLEFLLQVLDWITANPLRRGVNWACTMDVALRALNWIWGLRLFERDVARYPRTLRLIATSLHEHARHIECNLEYYPECTSNHYLSNVAGLLYIGAAFPTGSEADRWLRFGLQELISEMDRQVYDDGADHEASTNYHRLVAELFASSAAVAERIPPQRRALLQEVELGRPRLRPPLRSASATGLNLSSSGPILPQAFYAKLARMAEFTAALTKPNGLVPQFGDNDSARVHKLLPRAGEDLRDHRHLPAVVGELLDRNDLQNVGAVATDEARLVAGGLRGKIPSPPPSLDLAGAVSFFPCAGIAVLRRGQAYLAVTCGPNGQGGRGGHGHNDKGSFELNIEGLDIVVDGGCAAYTGAPEIRNRYRSTTVHSTVSVVGEEQDQWPPGAAGLFRLVEHSAPTLEVTAEGVITARHSGFGAEHRRRFTLQPGSLILDDVLDDPRPRQVVFNFDPSISVQGVTSTGAMVTCELMHSNGLRVEMSVTPATAPEVGLGAFSAGYGVPIDNFRLSVYMTSPKARTVLSWVE
jgi:hypothetical protein